MRHLQSTLLTAPVLSSLSVDVQSVMLKQNAQYHDDIVGQVHNHSNTMVILAATLKVNEEALLARNKQLEQECLESKQERLESKQEWLDLKQDVSKLKNNVLQLEQDMRELKNAGKLYLLHSDTKCLKLIIDLMHAHSSDPKQITLGRSPSSVQLHNRDRIDASHVIRAGERYDSAVVREQIRGHVQAASEVLDHKVEDVVLIEKRAQLAAYTEILKETQIHGDTFWIDPPHVQHSTKKSKLVTRDQHA
jgi:hypothetical protein